MKRTMIVMIALTMLLAWTGSAMAQVLADSKLHEVARANCKTGTTAWANAEFAMAFPYFAGATGSDWWGGIGLISTAEIETNNNINSGQLCFVAIDKDGVGTAEVFGQVIYAGNMRTVLVENIGEHAMWGKDIVVGVFRNEGAPAAAVNAMRGFGMIGNGVEGQGYFTGPAAAGPQNATELTFNYLPDTGWWKGIALFNNDRTATAYLKIDVLYEDGTQTGVPKGTVTRPTIGPGRLISEVIEDLVPDFDATKRSRIIVRSQAVGDTGNATGGPALMGFAMFGDGEQAMGYLGN